MTVKTKLSKHSGETSDTTDKQNLSCRWDKLVNRTLLNPIAVVSVREYLKLWIMLVRALSQTISKPKAVLISEDILLGKNK